MGIGAAFAAVGVGLQVAGFAKQQSALKEQNKFNVQVLQQQQQQEAVRHQAQALDAARRRRDIIRQGILAQSVATARATNQGAASQGTSALPGAFGQINGATDRNLLQVNQSEGLGDEMFKLNAGITQSKVSASRAGADAQFGAGLMSLGGAMIKDEGVFDRVGTYLTSEKKTTPYQGSNNPTYYGSSTLHTLY